MTPLRTKRLLIRNWEERDRPLFHRINSDEDVMRYFPFRRDRAQSDAVMDAMRADIDADGFGWTAVELAETGACLGFVGLNRAEIGPAAPADAIEIGWRLAPEFWGAGYVTEAATSLLDFAFDELARDEIISFAVATNRRSIAVMERLGMHRDPAKDFNHPRVPDSRPDLKRHVYYRLSRQDWRSRQT